MGGFFSILPLVSLVSANSISRMATFMGCILPATYILVEFGKGVLDIFSSLVMVYFRI
jgi:hypothetical protein